ncbi:MAG TPA: phenylalanine--tRNA ligase subunit beta [Gaiellaceae bacterium]|nr:phenylalanine--tRNA ligase subunit beta [Gaiellaceae bacterium]
MRVPLSWLREYVDVDADAATIAEALTISTAEVPTIERRGPADTTLFVVGRVLEADKHPNADRLQLCRVDVGEGKPAQIVCGAWNFGAGATVAVARPGATLPNGLTLERRELRGEMSEGMILAEDEIELGADHSGIIVLPDGLEPGSPLAAALPLVEEILDVDPTGNRVDLLSVYGIAREVAALFEGELRRMPGTDPQQDAEEDLDIRIEDFEGCPRYVGRLFRDVTIAESPLWLKARLRDAGVRSISNVVDVTNYVMLALGNPLHAFDFETLDGGRIAVRRARKAEKLTTLDGTERELGTDDLVIADAKRAVALAGIMGGEETEVSDGTTSVLLEAANFEPVGILRSSERLALRTEGSNRWEKGVDPHLAGPAAALATQLIVELAGARWVAAADVQGELPQPAVLPLRTARANELLGVEIAAQRQEEILARVGFEREKDGFRVPTWRARDVTREIDLVEEIARFELPSIPFTLPRREAMFGRLTRWQRVRRTVEDVLVGCGWSETYTPSLVPEGAIVLPEPISAELGAMRRTLLPSLVEAARANRAVDVESVALFELARTYPERGREPWHVAGVVDGGLAPAKWAVEQVYAALGIEPAYERASEPFLHPGKAAKTAEGWVGELHPAELEGVWGAFELDFDALVEAAGDTVRFEDVSPYPEVRQDLAFVVGEDVPAGAVLAAIRAAGGELLRGVEVFDEYRGEQTGEGRRSLAFRLAFGSTERTLTDEDVAPLREAIAAAVGEQLGGVLRG